MTDDTVLVMGAGASLAQAGGFRPVKQLQHPPLDRTFFSKAAELAASQRPVEERVTALRRAIRSSTLFQDPWDVLVTSMEQFFADVYYEVMDARSEEAFTIFVALLRLYNRVLGSTTNWMTNRSRNGIIDRLLREERRKTSGRLTVVTFNQDLLLEHVAARFPRCEGRWCLTSLYGDPVIKSLHARSDNLPHHNVECPHDPPFRLLKLHGSLNWMVRSNASEPKLGTLFPTTKKPIFYLAQKEVLLHNRMRQRNRGGRRTWHLWPLVVPPIYEKHRLTGTDLIHHQWAEARRALSNANRVVFVGYSLPDADVSAAQMLRRAVTDNQGLDVIHVVNPDPMIAPKIMERLQVGVAHQYMSVDLYLGHGRRL